MDLPPPTALPPSLPPGAALLQNAAAEHYAVLTRWLGDVAGVHGGLPVAQLNSHKAWLVDELLRPGQRWNERLPIAVEASARWRPDGVQASRFIIGTSIAAFASNRVSALATFGARMRLPAMVRARLATMLAANQVPSAVQIGLAAVATGWSRRLYLERGSLPVHMHALEWCKGELSERTYALHDPLSLDWLGAVPQPVRAAWQDLIAERADHPGLLRRDVAGQSVAMHVEMRRTAMAGRATGLLRLADALALPRAPIEAWLAQLPENAELTVVSLGRDGPLQMNVYVAPRQTDLPQPGPPPGDIRRAPGTVCWQLGVRGGEETRGWLLFALPNAQLALRPAAQSPAIQVWTGSSVPDAVGLATRLARLVRPELAALQDRLAQADGALMQALADAGLELRGPRP